MKKFLIYLILFITICAGTAACVVYNGYTEYNSHNSDNTLISSQPEDTLLTSLVSNVLSAESYSGNFNLSNSTKTLYINGTFSIINNNSLSAQIILSGELNNSPISANLTLYNNEIYIDAKETKVVLKTSDIMNTINSVIKCFEQPKTSELTEENSSIPELNVETAQSLLENITTIETESGYRISAPIKDICDLYILCDKDYLPTQILVSNLKFGEEIFTLSIVGSTTLKSITIPERKNFIQISPELDYLAPIINTLNQGNLGINGIINLRGTEIELHSRFINKEKLIGTINLGQISVKFQAETDKVLIDLYGNVFKLTYSELTEIVNKLTHSTPTKLTNKSISEESTLDNSLKEPNIYANIENTVIKNCFISIGDLTLDLEITKTLIIPNEINDKGALNKQDLIALIDGYSNLLSNEYSADLTFKHNNIQINGKIYVSIDNNFSSIKSLYFAGHINELPTIIIYSPKETFIQVSNNKIKLNNTTINNVINTVSNLTGVNEPEDQMNSLVPESTEEFLTSIRIKGRTIEFIYENLTAKINAYSNSFNISANSSDFNLSSTLYPQSSAYSYISNLIDKSTFKNFDNIDDLISAIVNTSNKNYVEFSGNLTIKLFDFKLSNVKINIKIYKNQQKLVLTLDNLPINGILTPYSSAFYASQKCVLTITPNNINIHSTGIQRFIGKSHTISNSNISPKEFNVKHLKNILNLRQQYIDMITKNSNDSNNNLNNNTNHISTNLSTELINVFKTTTFIDLEPLTNNFINEIYLQFEYEEQINNITGFMNIKDFIFIELNLDRK